MDDPFGLQRFVAAQDDGGTYDRALAELRRGRKTSHWMWFVFPQLAGLGQSTMSRRYAIASVDEARAYLAHSVLGPRLLDCAAALIGAERQDAVQILDEIDARKLHSSMTLFGRADPTAEAFRSVLERYFGGEPDLATMHLLEAAGPQG